MILEIYYDKLENFVRSVLFGNILKYFSDKYLMKNNYYLLTALYVPGKL